MIVQFSMRVEIALVLLCFGMDMLQNFTIIFVCAVYVTYYVHYGLFRLTGMHQLQLLALLCLRP